MRTAPQNAVIALAGVAAALLVAGAMAWLIFGPAITTSGGQCSGGSCTNFFSSTVPSGRRPILAVPLAGGVLLLVSAAITRWPAAAVVTSGLACLALAAITVLGLASIGPLFIRADVAAATTLALLIGALAR